MLFPVTNYRVRFSNNVKDLCDSNTKYHDLSIHVSPVSLPNDESNLILASSNGLVLLLSIVVKNDGRCPFYVYNPLTKECVRLPMNTLKYSRVFNFATRLMGDRAATFLSYRVVIIRCLLRHIHPHEYVDTTLEIFSSDTGSWAASELVGCCPREFFESGFAVESFSQRGILHWLCSRKDTIMTFDPYDRPDRFGHIPLPRIGNYSSSCYKSLIYSGGGEMIKCCEIDKGGSGVDRVSVWKLVDSGKGEWFLEGEFRVPSLLYEWERHMVSPCPWDREVVCNPYVRDKKVWVINPSTGRREFVEVFEESAPFTFSTRPYSLLVPIELSPWSSPKMMA